ncbi:hypothetical protein BDF19DRAFT_175411 [Syncephalis fuscata]|nr:hypothetical protein BDF19DRAFT_175411 [Syncephalis fuscata]
MTTPTIATNEDLANNSLSSPISVPPIKRRKPLPPTATTPTSNPCSITVKSNSSTISTDSLFSQERKLFFPSNIAVLAGKPLSEAKTPTKVEKSGNLRRQLKAPLRYTCVSSYRKVFTRMIYEHLQVLLCEQSIRFHTVALGNRYSGMSAAEKYYRSRGISFYGHCTLSIQYSGANHSSAVQDTFLLKLDQYEHSSKYAKDDLWILSKDRLFKSESTFLARSTFYGPSSTTSSIQLKSLNEQDIFKLRQLQIECAGLCAIRAFNASSEYTMLELFESEGLLENTPIMPAILSHTIRSSSMNYMADEQEIEQSLQLKEAMMDEASFIRASLKQLIEQYKLNEDQQKVMHSFAYMLSRPKHLPTAPLLIHGVFGAGKSFLIGIMVLFVMRILNPLREKESKPLCRLLITAMTNVAVDNILEGLIQIEFHDFVRVGR